MLVPILLGIVLSLILINLVCWISLYYLAERALHALELNSKLIKSLSLLLERKAL